MFDFCCILGFCCFNEFWWGGGGLTSDGGGGWVVMVGRCWVDGGICILVVVLLHVLCICVGVCVHQRKKMRTSSDLLKDNLVIAHRVQQIFDSTRTCFFQNGPLSSFLILRVLFTNPKRNFFQKVTQTDFEH